MQSLNLPDALRQAAGKSDLVAQGKHAFFSRWDAVVLLGSALYLFLFLPHPWFSGDAGFIAAGTERIVRGQVPFRDFFTELGPGTYYLLAGAFKLLGVSLTALNALVWLMGLAISWLIYRLGRLILDGPLAILPSFFFIGICYPLWYSFSHHWTGSLFFLLALLCLAESVSHSGPWGERAQGGIWLAAGFLSVAALTCLQTKGVIALLLGLAYLLVAGKYCGERTWGASVQKGWRRGLWFVVGFAAAFGVMLLFFSLQDAARDWLYDNFVFLVTNYWPFVHPSGSLWHALFHPLSTLLSRPSVSLALAVLGYYFFMAVGPLLVVLGSVWAVRRLRETDNVRARLMLLYALGSTGAFVSEIHSLDLEHFMLGGIFIFPVLLCVFQTYCRRSPRGRRLLASGAAALTAFVILGSAGQAFEAAKRNTPVESRRGTVYVLPQDAHQLSEKVEMVQSRVPAGGETFLFMEDPSLYFLTATVNPTRFDNVLPAFHTPAQIAEVARTLSLRRPMLVFDFSEKEALTEPIVVIPHPLENYLRSPQSPYQLEQEVGTMKIWALKK